MKVVLAPEIPCAEAEPACLVPQPLATAPWNRLALPCQNRETWAARPGPMEQPGPAKLSGERTVLTADPGEGCSRTRRRDNDLGRRGSG